MLALCLAGAVTVKEGCSIMESPERKKRYCVFFAFVLWVLLAFKGDEIGSDTPAYIRVFEEALDWVKFNVPQGNFLKELFQNTSRYETGYVALNRIIGYFTQNHQWLFIIFATFAMVTMYKFIMRKSDNVWVSMYLFVSLRFYYFFMSGLRQAIAMVICIISYKFVEKRKLFPFLLCVIAAMLFHRSAILFSIVYPLSFLKFSLKNGAVVVGGGLVAFIFFDKILASVLNILPDYYAHYTTSVRFEENNLGNILVGIIQFLFLVLLLLPKGSDEKPQGNFDEKSMLSFMILISCMLSFISLKATTLDRLFQYFWIYVIIYAPKVIKDIQEEYRGIVTFGITVFTFAYNVVLLYARPEWSNITPYFFFWQ